MLSGIEIFKFSVSDHLNYGSETEVRKYIAELINLRRFAISLQHYTDFLLQAGGRGAPQNGFCPPKI